MVCGVARRARARRIHDAAGEEHEDGRLGPHRHRHRLLRDKRQEARHRQRVVDARARRHERVAPWPRRVDGCRRRAAGGGVAGAGHARAAARVRVGGLGAQAAHRRRVLKGRLHGAAAAAALAIGRRAVDELLLGQPGRRPTRGHGCRALQCACRRKGPAGAALALVLDRRDGAGGHPVDAARCRPQAAALAAACQRAAVARADARLEAAGEARLPLGR